MKHSEKLRAIKRSLSPEVLRIEGVSGLGLPDDKLTVYLEEDTSEVRRRVKSVMDKKGVTAPVEWRVTGKIGLQARP
ncbi:MAG TPA: hypothetical protein VL285_13865 [Bryobacteraceae bacterium]|nr:hypothetical protein [Bryobacteraceae bacterium]